MLASSADNLLSCRDSTKKIQHKCEHFTMKRRVFLSVILYLCHDFLCGGAKLHKKVLGGAFFLMQALQQNMYTS